MVRSEEQGGKLKTLTVLQGRRKKERESQLVFCWRVRSHTTLTIMVLENATDVDLGLCVNIVCGYSVSLEI